MKEMLAAIAPLACGLEMRAMRHSHVFMTERSVDGLSTKSRPTESMAPKIIDLAAAAASQEGLKDMAPIDFTPPKPKVDSLRVGDGILAGDVGFDPLGLADTPRALSWYREAEIKHSRLAMLAAVGWPISEKLDAPLARMFGADTMLVDGRAPSLFNGGMAKVSVFYWLATLGIAAAAESTYIDKQLGFTKQTDYLPGMVGWDPLNMDGPGTRNAEIWGGRAAMIAVAVYALEEWVTKAPVVEESAVLFQPIWTLGGMASTLDAAGVPGMVVPLSEKIGEL